MNTEGDRRLSQVQVKRLTMLVLANPEVVTLGLRGADGTSHPNRPVASETSRVARKAVLGGARGQVAYYSGSWPGCHRREDFAEKAQSEAEKTSKALVPLGHPCQIPSCLLDFTVGLCLAH